MRHLFPVITALFIFFNAACEAESPPLRLGLIASLTGFASAYGVAVREGVELAVEILGILISSAESHMQVILQNAFTLSLITRPSLMPI